jgi:predicted nuclease of predicted toxin-antitoxin system
LLLDQGIPADSSALFREVGHDCKHVSEFGMQKASDEEILAFASDGNWCLITLDADFHQLVAVRGLARPSVVRLRREGCRAEMVVRLVRDVLLRYREQILSGCLISVKEKRVTCHALPVGCER